MPSCHCHVPPRKVLFAGSPPCHKKDQPCARCTHVHQYVAKSWSAYRPHPAEQQQCVWHQLFLAPSCRFCGAQHGRFGASVHVVWEKPHVPDDELVCSRAVVIVIAKATEPSRFATYIPLIDVTVKTQSPPLHD